VIWINSIGNAIGLLFSIVLILEYRTIRGIISDCCISSLIVFCQLLFYEQRNYVLKSMRSAFDFEIIKFVFLFSYGTGFIRFGTYGFLAIRNNIIQTLDYSQAGYWETMMRISTYYML
jgi:PST family polysaccharide transporter